MMANMPLSTDVTACLPTGAGKAMPGMEGEGADFSAMLEHIKVGAATPQLPIATNLIPAPVAAEASSTAQKMPGVDAAQIGATALGEPDADISGAAPNITPAIQPKAIPGQNPPATQADKQVQTEIEIPAKFAQTASNVPQITIAMMGTEMGKGSPKAEKSDSGIQGGSKHGDKVEADQKEGESILADGLALPLLQMVGLSVPSPHAAAPAIAVPSPGASPVALSASSASSQAISASSGESAGASPMPEANITAPAQLTPNAAPFVLADAVMSATPLQGSGPAVDTGSVLADRVIDMGVDGQWIDRMAREIADISAGTGRATFMLNPANLGKLQVDIIQGEEGANVRLTAETDAAATALQQGRHQLQQDSRLQAVRINDVQVERSNDSSASSSGGRGQSMGQEQAGQQNQSQAHKRPLAEAVSMFANGQEPDQPVSARVSRQRARYA